MNDRRRRDRLEPLRRLARLLPRRTRALPVARIGPWLMIGPALPTRDYRTLRDLGVRVVVDLRQEASDEADALSALGLRVEAVPVPDGGTPADGQVEALAARLSRDLRPGEVVYLHCREGLQRTPTVAIALLMLRGYSLAEAHEVVRGALPSARPRRVQLAWLEALEARLALERPAPHS